MSTICSTLAGNRSVCRSSRSEIYPDAARNRNHLSASSARQGRLRTSRTRPNSSASMPRSTRTRRPAPSSISLTAHHSAPRKLRGRPIFCERRRRRHRSGDNPDRKQDGRGGGARAPSRACQRDATTRLYDRPCRRATLQATTPGGTVVFDDIKFRLAVPPWTPPGVQTPWCGRRDSARSPCTGKQRRSQFAGSPLVPIPYRALSEALRPFKGGGVAQIYGLRSIGLDDSVPCGYPIPSVAAKSYIVLAQSYCSRLI
jgi:hypothetical protein